MKKHCSSLVLFLFSGIISLSVQLSMPEEGYSAPVTGSTSMTVVTVREWKTANSEPPAQWPTKYGVYNYILRGKEVIWSNNPSPIPFPRDVNGTRGGLLWSIYDYRCVSGNKVSAGNRSFIAFAWDFVGPGSTYKDHGGAPPACEDWIGMMVTTIWKDDNRQGRERSNLIFTSHQ